MPAVSWDDHHVACDEVVRTRRLHSEDGHLGHPGEEHRPLHDDRQPSLYPLGAKERSPRLRMDANASREARQA